MNIRKFIVGLAVICMLCYAGTAFATAPDKEPEIGDQAVHTMVVSVEDITAVMEQLERYEADVDMLAKLIWAEARGINSKAEQAAVIWCALNRVDAGFADSTISSVVRARSQFAYSSGSPIKKELRSLAQDVVIRWLLEKRGIGEVGRVLPSDYLYFAGHDGHNWFRKSYRGGKYWDWSLPDPYVDQIEVLDSAA
jgi:hypothetical protein